jgi:hypothetical protein
MYQYILTRRKLMERNLFKKKKKKKRTSLFSVDAKYG